MGILKNARCGGVFMSHIGTTDSDIFTKILKRNVGGLSGMETPLSQNGSYATINPVLVSVIRFIQKSLFVFCVKKILIEVRFAYSLF